MNSPVCAPTNPHPAILTVSEVQQQLLELDGAIGDVRSLCSTVYTRLNQVLRAIPGVEVLQDQKPEPTLCPLAHELRQKTKELRSVARDLETLLSRIEV